MIHKPVITNSIWLLAGRVSSVLLNLLIVALAGRILGDDGFGQYSFLLAYTSLAAVVTAFGMDTHIVRLVAKPNQDSLSSQISGAILLQLMLAVAVIGLSLIWVTVEEKAIVHSSHLLLYLLVLVPGIFTTVFYGILKGMEKMGAFVLCQLTDLIVQVIAILWLLSQDAGVVQFAFVMMAGRLIALLVSWLFVRYYAAVGWTFRLPSLPHFRTLIKAGGYISLSVIIAVALQRLGVFVLTFAASPSDVGVFNAAYKVVEGFKILPAALYGAMFPAMVRGNGAFSMKGKGLLGLVIPVLVLGTTAWLLSDHIFMLLFQGFDGSSDLFRILIIGIIPFMIRQYYAFRFLASGQEKLVFLMGLTSLITALLVYYPAFVHYGVSGLCWAVNGVLMVESLLYLMIRKRLTSVS